MTARLAVDREQIATFVDAAFKNAPQGGYVQLRAFRDRGGIEKFDAAKSAWPSAREWPAITTANAGNTAVRTERWRYIRYADGSEELYDELADRNEWTNLAADPHYATVKAELAQWLPKTYAAPAPGSADRTLTYTNGIANWEGKDIPANAPIPGLDQD